MSFSFPKITAQLVKSIGYFDVCVSYGLSRTVFFIHKLDIAEIRKVFYTCEIEHSKECTTTSRTWGRHYVIGIERVKVHKTTNNKQRKQGWT